MKLVIGSDHAGFPLKNELVRYLRAQGHDVLDVGTDSAEVPVDYPDFASAVAHKIVSHEAERGIIVCGSGIGACITANKIPGIYAGLTHDTYSAHQGVEHDNMNVICLGSRIIGPALAYEIVNAFINARFQANEERHVRRLHKMLAIEQHGIGADHKS